MKVLYDHQAFVMQDYGGISRIFTEFLKSPNRQGFSKELSIVSSNNEYLKEVEGVSFYNFFKPSKWKYKASAMQAINKIYTINKLKKSDFDIFHPTYYDPYFIKHLKRKPFVITFLDLIHERFEKEYDVFAKDRTVMEGKKILLNESAKIIAISESTKNDIVEFYGVDKSKIEVIYLGSSLRKEKDNNKPIVEGAYILFIGNRAIYKNFRFFLEAISGILKQNSRLKLVCGGGGRFTEDENSFIQQLGLQNQIQQQPFYDDEALANFYSHALCFVFPSLYEGFGIPVLEAFSCGCPCAISNCSSLPEVGGDAALYFDPEDANSISKAVDTLINDQNLRLEMIKRGNERLLLFSWEKTIEQTFQFYKTVV